MGLCAHSYLVLLDAERTVNILSSSNPERKFFNNGQLNAETMDGKYLVNLLREAEQSKLLVIQKLAPECDRIEQLLLDDGIDIPVRKNTSLF
jgi:hypothetical protein